MPPVVETDLLGPPTAATPLLLLKRAAENATAAATVGAQDASRGSWRGGMSTSGVGLIAMVVSDSGLASTEPQWWNASPLGCFLIGLQPRGGWQILQRGVQWGSDSFSSTFGVSCPEPVLYCHFAATIRNRIEVWNSSRFYSPMLHRTPRDGWKDFPGRCSISRPSKLVDGSRGGQAFLCSLLRPRPGSHYSVAEQARMQMLSVLLVAASLIPDLDFEPPPAAPPGTANPTTSPANLATKPASPASPVSPANQANPSAASRSALDEVMEKDFEMASSMGSVFTCFIYWLVAVNVVVAAALGAVFYDLWVHNIFGAASPYVDKLVSYAAWANGSVGILMLGGNPRVLVRWGNTLLPYVEKRLLELEADTDAADDSASDSGASLTASTSTTVAAVAAIPTTGTANSNSNNGAATAPIPVTPASPASPAVASTPPTATTTLPTTTATTATTAAATPTTVATSPASTNTGTNTPLPARKIRLQFGSLHGSVFTEDKGSCYLPAHVVRKICSSDLELCRTPGWVAGMAWCGLQLALSMVLQIAASQGAVVGSEVLGIVVLIVTAVLRGIGLSGPEEWQIPAWKMRPGASYGAIMVGLFASRAGSAS